MSTIDIMMDEIKESFSYHFFGQNLMDIRKLNTSVRLFVNGQSIYLENALDLSQNIIVKIKNVEDNVEYIENFESHIQNNYDKQWLIDDHVLEKLHLFISSIVANKKMSLDIILIRPTDYLLEVLFDKINFYNIISIDLIN